MAITTPFKQICPSCEAPMTIRDAALVGKKVECAKCKYRFVIEKPAEAAGKKSREDDDDEPRKSKNGVAASAKSRTAPGKKKVQDDEEAEEVDLEDADEEEAPAKGRANGKADSKGKKPAKPARDEDEDEDDEEEKPKAKGKGKGKDEDDDGKGKKKKKKQKAASGGGMDKKKFRLIIAGSALLLLTVVAVIVWMGRGNTPAAKTPAKDGDKGGKDQIAGMDSTKVKGGDKPAGGDKKTLPEVGGSSKVPPGVRMSNWLPKTTESVQHCFFKDYLVSPLGQAAELLLRDDPNNENEFRRHLGFSPTKIVEMIRAQSFKGEWCFTILHTEETIGDLTPLVQAMKLKGQETSDLQSKEYPYYEVGQNAAYAEGLSRLALGVPAFLRTNVDDVLKAPPVMFRKHDKHTLVFAHKTAMLQFLKDARAPIPKSTKPAEGGKDKGKDAAKDKKDGAKGKDMPMPTKDMPMPMPTKDNPMPMPTKDNPMPTKDMPMPMPTKDKKEGTSGDKDKESTEPLVEVELPYSTINPKLRDVLMRMRGKPDDEEVPIVASAIDLKAARALVAKQGTAQPRLQWQLRAVWDLADVLGESGNGVPILGTSVRQKDDLLIYANELDCASEKAAKLLLVELKHKRASEVADLFGRLLRGHVIALPPEPVEEKKEDKNNPMRPPIMPNDPMKKKKEDEEKKEEPPKSQILATQDGSRVLFTLELLLKADARKTQFLPAFRALLYGLKTDLALASAVEQYRLSATKTPGENNALLHRLAGAGKKLGEKETYGPGAYPRTGPRYTREPMSRVSFMAGLLPFTGHNQLYSQIDLKQSWKDPANWLAAQTLIPEFLDPTYPAASRYGSHSQMPLGTANTHFAGLAGIGLDAADAALDDPAMMHKLGVFGNDRVTPVKDMVRGTSNTILMVRVPYNGTPGATPWMAGGGGTVRHVPEDNSLEPFLTQENGGKGTFLLMADGSVRYVKADPDKDRRAKQDALFRTLATVKGPKDQDVEDLTIKVPSKQGTPTPIIKEPPQKEPEKKEPEKKVPETKDLPNVKIPDGWISFTDEVHGFSVHLPKQPIVHSAAVIQNRLKKAGLEVTHLPVEYISPVGKPGGLRFEVLVVSLSPESANLKPDEIFKRFASARKAMTGVDDVKLKVTATKLVNPLGQEWELSFGSIKMDFCRVILANNQLFHVSAVGMSDGDAISQAKYQDYFNSFRLGNEKKTEPVSKDPPEAGKALAGWQRFTSQEDGFSVLMPETTKMTSVLLGQGGPTRRVYASKASGSTTELKIYSMPAIDKDADAFFRVMSYSYREQLPKGASLKEKVISVGKYPAREFETYSGGKLVQLARLVLVNDRYLSYSAGIEQNLTPAEMRAFVDSLRFNAK